MLTVWAYLTQLMNRYTVIVLSVITAFLYARKQGKDAVKQELQENNVKLRDKIDDVRAKDSEFRAGGTDAIVDELRDTKF